MPLSLEEILALPDIGQKIAYLKKGRKTELPDRCKLWDDWNPERHEISVTLWILNQNKKGGKYHGRNLRNREYEILFMDLRQWTENAVKGESKKKVRLDTEQIEKAADIYHTWQCEETDGAAYEIPELYRSVCINEIESKGWALTPSKYIEFIDHDLEIDYEKEMARIQSEMKEIMKQEKKSP